MVGSYKFLLMNGNDHKQHAQMVQLMARSDIPAILGEREAKHLLANALR